MRSSPSTQDRGHKWEEHTKFKQARIEPRALRAKTTCDDGPHLRVLCYPTCKIPPEVGNKRSPYCAMRDQRPRPVAGAAPAPTMPPTKTQRLFMYTPGSRFVLGANCGGHSHRTCGTQRIWPPHVPCRGGRHRLIHPSRQWHATSPAGRLHRIVFCSRAA